MKKNTLIYATACLAVLGNACGSGGPSNSQESSPPVVAPERSNSGSSPLVVPAPLPAPLPAPVPPSIIPPSGQIPIVGGPPPFAQGYGKPIGPGFGKPPIVPPPIAIPPIGPVPGPGPFPGGPFPGGPFPGGPIAGDLPPVAVPLPGPGTPNIPGVPNFKMITGKFSLTRAHCSRSGSAPIPSEVVYGFDSATSGMISMPDSQRGTRQIALKLNYEDGEKLIAEPNGTIHCIKSDGTSIDCPSEMSDRNVLNQFAFDGTPHLDEGTLKIRGHFSPELFNCGSDRRPEPAVELEFDQTR